MTSCADVLAGRAPNRRAVTAEGLGAHPARLEGRLLVHPPVGRLVVPSGAGGRAEGPAELRKGGPAPHSRAARSRPPAPSCPRPPRASRSRCRRARSRSSAGSTTPTPTRSSPSRTRFEFLREVAHLRPRTNVIGAVTRVRHTLAQAIHRFFHERGFVWVNTPIITAADAEGAGALFRVSTLDLANLPRTRRARSISRKDFFGREAFLTVSGQLNVEAYCLALSKVYTFGPTFRAENSNTSRHLAEFWMIEPEIAFADLADNADLAEALLEVHLRRAARESARRHGVLRRARREGHRRQAAGHRRLGVRAHGLQRGDRDPRSARRRSSSSR